MEIYKFSSRFPDSEHQFVLKATSLKLGDEKKRILKVLKEASSLLISA